MTGNGFDYDVIVIASGFGGSVAALRATEPIGAQGIAAIYTGGEHGAWAALRKISIRAHSWINWLYPINF
jgi:hypothetical protein